MPHVAVPPLPADLRDPYLAHLGVVHGHVGTEPTLERLVALHAAHLDRVAYTNLDVQLGRPGSIDPRQSVERILDGRGGYCFHLNGAFSALLRSLGYEVVLARAAVPAAGDGGRRWGNHVVPLVWLAGEVFVVDVGIGDGIRSPLRLAEGTSVQPPFRYRLEHRGGERWRLDHDRRAFVPGLDLDTTPVELSRFAATHTDLSTSADSYFVRYFTVQRRAADHVLTMRGRVLTRVDTSGTSCRMIHNREEWEAVLVEKFGLVLPIKSEHERSALWRRVYAPHAAR
ncbi:arylamine N-acetyltransferase family protein [Pseudonocardia charpentierae]|uniref:Arylamine N-acetyltransferase n=1 Tax=Pseudonocardia charpentierae TaxID=3075545 RepID=A0ABU2N2I3_9PSEU|nr:arylamine N-acetyltransferase [Pseudonocardia sp. DSM 45834]MDT0348125.1 arylamine N-acetyltransferase [Pseudonocardia sp. DSM 45834]